MTNFTIDLTNLEEQIAYGSGHISVPVSVVGFWSNPIDLRIRRAFNWSSAKQADVDGEWEFEVTHSSGGKDSKVCDMLTSERNFAAALNAALDLVEQLQSRVTEMEAAYQNRLAIEKAAFEVAQAEKAARIEADPAPAASIAQAFIDSLIANARMTKVAGRRCTLSARARGEADDRRVEFSAERSWNDRVTLRFSGDVISRKAAIAKLGEFARKGITLTTPDEA